MDVVQALIWLLLLFCPIPILWLLLPLESRPLIIVWFGPALLFLIFARIFVIDAKPESYTLRIDRQKITRISKNGWKIKEHRMSVNGAKFHAVHFDFLERVFTFDLCRTDSAFHVKFTQSGEIFHFPCFDEKEQTQIVGKIKEFLSQKDETGVQESRSSIPEWRMENAAFLQWTFERRFGGTHILLALREMLASLFIVIPLLVIFRWAWGLRSVRGKHDLSDFLSNFFHLHPMDSHYSTIFAIFAIVIVLMLLSTLVLTLFAPRGSLRRTLRIDRQAITLTDTTVWRTIERRMHTDGAKFFAAHFDFFERVFAFDRYRPDSAYHVEITRNDQTFLFPCHDAKEQTQIIKQVKEFLPQ